MSWQRRTWPGAFGPVCRLAAVGILAACVARADDASWAIYVMQADGSQARRVVHVDGFLAHGSPRWSHDGKQLAFDANGGPNGARRIFVVNTAGDNLRKLGEHAMPDWSPDDKQLLFMRYTAGQPNIDVQNLDGKGQTTLTQGGCGRWSADGSQILFMDATEQSLLALDLASGEERVLLEGKYARIEPGFEWSPDAKRVALIGVDATNDGRELAILDVSGGQRVVPTKGRLEGGVSWSPDGKRLAVCIDFKVTIVDVDGSNPARTVPGQVGRGTDPAWSPDGKSFAFASDRPE